MGVVEDHRPARLARTPDRVGAFGLHADHANSGEPLLQCQRRARQKPAAAHAHEDQVDVGHVVVDLEPDRALAGDDQRVGVGVHEGLALLAFDLVRERERVVVHLAGEQHLRSIRAAHAHGRL